MQPLLLGQGPALKVRIGCIVRCTPEGHVCYLFSAFKLHRLLPRFSCRGAGPTRHSEKKILCLSKNEPSDCGGCHFPQDLRGNVQYILRNAPFSLPLGCPIKFQRIYNSTGLCHLDGRMGV